MNKCCNQLHIYPILLFLLLLGLSCSEKNVPNRNKKKKSSPVVRVKTVTMETIQDRLSLTGSIEPERLARLASPAEGPIKNLYVREGDVVKAGQTVLKIGRTKALDAQSAAAKEMLRLERDELARTKRLVESGAIAAEELDQVVTRVSKAEADLAKATEFLRDYRIVAPWKGVIGRVLATEGEFVAPRQFVVEMFDPDSLVLRFALPERNAMHVKKNQQMVVHFDAIPEKTFTASVIRIYPELDRILRTRTIEAKIISTDTALSPGMFARLELIMSVIPNATVVPSEAIVITPNGHPVVHVVENNKAFRRSVRLGIHTENSTQILEGLSPGEIIVVAGNEKLKDGVSVQLASDSKKPVIPNKKNAGS